MTQRIEDLIDVLKKSKGPLTSLQIIEEMASKGYNAVEARKIIAEALRQGLIRKIRSNSKELFSLPEKGEF
ncbi:hypothetical protein EYM_04260 [Ignicoccus islandicus DSM 13165]|uniref:Uncharacterized protein n=1 Tax=Ignicoccus islandicus DSM 13165 TaxID=940295 RepID=A0A0U3FSK8_9CREN|nr:hypothetical protein [Ignicoccus islandicus]ALU12480.1 hypothetical protein EYM_04260 [Ignicoccus islandicus DSM 13165]